MGHDHLSHMVGVRDRGYTVTKLGNRILVYLSLVLVARTACSALLLVESGCLVRLVHCPRSTSQAVGFLSSAVFMYSTKQHTELVESNPNRGSLVPIGPLVVVPFPAGLTSSPEYLLPGGHTAEVPVHSITQPQFFRVTWPTIIAKLRRADVCCCSSIGPRAVVSFSRTTWGFLGISGARSGGFGIATTDRSRPPEIQ